MTRRRQPVVLSFLLLAVACIAEPPTTAPATRPTGPQPQSLPTTQVTINGTALTLQVADDDAKREKGLMYTTQMPADHGMIFVFPLQLELSFWMRNTPIDLDIIYLDRDRKVVSVKTMKAHDESTVSSDGPSTYAIELNAGEAAKLKVVAGQIIDLPASLAKDAK